MAESTDIMLTIGSQLDEKGFEALQEQLKKVGVQAQRVGDDGKLALKKLDEGAGKAGNSFLELAAKIGLAYKGVQSMITAYVEDAKAGAKLTLALKNNTDEINRQGKSVSDLTKEFKDFASAQQAATGIGDEVTLSLMGTLTTLGVLPKDIKRVTVALQDMEAVTGMSADSMARAWARLQEAPEEALGALSRAGVKLKKEMLEGMDAEQQRIFVLEKIEKAFGNQAKTMADATGGIAQAKAAFGDFLEVLGKVVVGLLKPFLDIITPVLTFFNNLPSGVSSAIVMIGGLTTAWLALNGAIKMTPVGWILSIGAAVGGLVGIFGKASISADEAQDTIDKLNSTSKKFEAQQKATSRTTLDLVDKLSRAKEGTREYTGLVKDLLKENPSLVNSNISIASSYNDIANAVNAAGNALEKGAMADAYKKGIADLEKLADTAKDLFLAASSDDASRDQLNALLVKREKLRQSLLDIADKFGYERGAIESSYAFGGGSFSQMAGYRAFLSRRAAGNMGNYIGGLMNADIRNEVARRSQASQTKQFGGVPIGTPGGGDGKDKKDSVDLWKMRIDLMDNEFERRKQLNMKNYFEEEDNINKLDIDKTAREKALSLNRQKFLAEEKKIAEDEIKAEEEAKLALMQKVGEATLDAFSIGTSVIKGDWSDAINGVVSKIGGTLGPTIAGALSASVGFVSALDGLLRKSAVKFGDEVADALEAAGNRETWRQALETAFGINAEQATSQAVRDAEANLRALESAWDKTLAGWAADKTDLMGTSSEDLTKYKEFIEKMRNLRNTNIKTDEFWRQFWAGADAAGLNRDMAQIMFGSAMAEGQKFFDFLAKVIEAKKDIADARAADAINTYMDNIKKIKDQVDTGRMDDEEARKQMIEQYDAAIASLQGVAGAEALIIELEKERYRLQKGITEETEKQMLNQKQQQLLAEIDALERDIGTGRAKKDYSTLTKLQGLYNDLLGSMKSSGLFGTSAYTGIEDRLTNWVKDTLGTTGFAAASGTGFNASIPMIGGRIAQQPIVKVDGRNTSTSQTIINAPLNLPPELTTWLLRAVNAQSGRGF